jgi:hypothetical protein
MSRHTSITEILKFTSFPRLISDQQNESQDAKVSKDELKLVLQSFKNKEPKLGWLGTKFSLGFYEFLEEELLRVIEEYKTSRKFLGD